MLKTITSWNKVKKVNLKVILKYFDITLYGPSRFKIGFIENGGPGGSPLKDTFSWKY